MDDILQAGAALRSGKLYVERPADAEIWKALGNSEFCHVLAPRQIGKTSLCHRAIRRLADKGARCALIELLSMGTKTASVDQWYRTFSGRLASQVGLDLDVDAFWMRNIDLSPVERWMRLIRDEIAPKESSPVVIVVDEIDALLSRPELGDEFFGAVRAFANARATTPAYEHLAFCLVGVCAPTDLVWDRLVTPYNIASRAIRLEDFTRRELDAFAARLGGLLGDPRELLDEVFQHTEGHPYLTQALLVGLRDRDRFTSSIPPFSAKAAALKSAQPMTCAERVEAVVLEKFLSPIEGRDPNLAYAEERFKAYETGHDGAAILRLYRRLIEGERIVAKSDDPQQMALRLTGMAAERRETDRSHAVIRVRNPIFAAVFDRAWVKEREAKRLVTDPLTRWQENGRRDDFLPEGEALDAALAWAKTSEDLNPEECRFLVLAVERAGKKRLERAELAGTADLERALRGRAEIEAQTETRVGRLRAAVGKERRRTLYALSSALLVTLTLGVVSFYYRQKVQMMDADRASLQETLNRQKEEFARVSAQLAERLKEANLEVDRREQEADLAKKRADALEQKAKEAEELAQNRTADAQFRARQARKDADEAKRTVEEAKGLLLSAKQAERDASDRYNEAKKQAEDAERRAREAVASEKRTKELAEAAVQAEREARIKVLADLTAERTISDAERKLRVTAEADRKACQDAKQNVDSDLAECRARLLPASPDRFKLP